MAISLATYPWETEARPATIADASAYRQPRKSSRDPRIYDASVNKKLSLNGWPVLDDSSFYKCRYLVVVRRNSRGVFLTLYGLFGQAGRTSLESMKHLYGLTARHLQDSMNAAVSGP